MRPTTSTLLLATVLALALHLTSAQERRLLAVDDLFALRTVSSPQVSPDGDWVAYQVSTLDEKSDRSNTDLYMVPFDGGDPIQLTFTPGSESSPRWSPDSRYLAILSVSTVGSSSASVMTSASREASGD